MKTSRYLNIKLIRIFILLLLFLVIDKFSYSSNVIESDMNHDGKPDSWTYITNGYVDKQEIDMNFDGKIDTVYLYEEGNKVKEEMLDTNYDGKMDNWRYFNLGKLVIEEIDNNYDGKVDVWFYVDRGRIYKIGRDIDGDGTVDEVVNY